MEFMECFVSVEVFLTHDIPWAIPIPIGNPHGTFVRQFLWDSVSSHGDCRPGLSREFTWEIPWEIRRPVLIENCSW